MAPEKSGRAVHPVVVRPRTQAQRDCLVAAAAAAKVSLSYYLLESALMVADHEGFHPSRAARWVPSVPKTRRTG